MAKHLDEMAAHDDEVREKRAQRINERRATAFEPSDFLGDYDNEAAHEDDPTCLSPAATGCNGGLGGVKGEPGSAPVEHGGYHLLSPGEGVATEREVEDYEALYLTSRSHTKHLQLAHHQRDHHDDASRPRSSSLPTPDSLKTPPHIKSAIKKARRDKDTTQQAAGAKKAGFR